MKLGNKQISREESIKRLEAIRKEYDESGVKDTFSAMIMGMYGTGKTSILATARMPLLLCSFDPRGTLVLRDEIKEGRIIVRTYWNEDSSQPTEYMRWQKDWREDIDSGFLTLFGTYAIDSLTTFITALANYTSKRKGREKGVLAQGDYIPMYASVNDHIKITQAQGCDFIMTGHLVMEKDEIEGRSYAELGVYKGLKVQIPILFTEKYVLEVTNTSKGSEYKLLTGRKGPYRASTQLGKKGIFELEEEPNIKHLLKKAGLPHEDKPTLK